jgi:hypothetical protein
MLICFIQISIQRDSVYMTLVTTLEQMFSSRCLSDFELRDSDDLAS